MSAPYFEVRTSVGTSRLYASVTGRASVQFRDVAVFNRWPHMTPGEEESMGRIMALVEAAPEMLAALDLAEEAFDFDGKVFRVSSADRIEAATRAIASARAKARGL